jgi:hypothetical protein
MEYLFHIPASASKAWKVIPSDSPDYPAIQHHFLIQKEPFRVGIQFPTPSKLVALNKNLKQLDHLSRAALETLEDLKPAFHRYILEGQLVETTGTSIAITGLDISKKYVLTGTLDFGETMSEGLSRLAMQRRMWKELPAATMYRFQPFVGLPPPQMVLSNVISSGIKWPIGGLSCGYGEGTMFPTSLTIGIEHSCLMVDHRLINPNEEQKFIDVFLAKLEQAL